MLIRFAKHEEAPFICALLIRSITHCCVLDHQNDPGVLARWTDNKKPAILATWITDPDTAFFVGVQDGRIIALASLHRSGEIGLNYVDPDYRGQGHSKAMLARLEEQARAWGLSVCRLSSTLTARGFYRACGYREGAEKKGAFAPVVIEMEKNLFAV